MIENGTIESDTGELATAVEQITALRGEVAALTTEAVTLRAENARLAAAVVDFERRVATEVAKCGIRKSAVSVPQGGGPVTATEKAMAARAGQ
jgi:hypothetical protein